MVRSRTCPSSSAGSSSSTKEKSLSWGSPTGREARRIWVVFTVAMLLTRRPCPGTVTSWVPRYARSTTRRAPRVTPASERTGRDETVEERADRNWNELLQEFRVLQTGVQILGGFLLTLPFQSRFADLDDFQRTLYLVLVLLATVSTCAMLAPIALHRRVFRWRRKQRLVAAGHRLAQVVMVLVGLLVTGIAVFVFDVVLDRQAALIVGCAMSALVLVALVGIPLLAGGRHPPRHPEA